MPVVVAPCPHSKRFAGVGKAVVNEMTDEIVCGPVVREPALVPRRDESHPSQEGQLVARDREREIECVRDVADGERVMGEGVHEREANRVREEPEDLRGLAERLPWRQSVPSRPNSSRADDFGEHVLGVCRFHT